MRRSTNHKQEVPKNSLPPMLMLKFLNEYYKKLFKRGFKLLDT